VGKNLRKNQRSIDMSLKNFNPERIGMGICPDCNGCGRKKGAVCSKCGGFGFVRKGGDVPYTSDTDGPGSIRPAWNGFFALMTLA